MEEEKKVKLPPPPLSPPHSTFDLDDDSLLSPPSPFPSSSSSLLFSNSNFLSRLRQREGQGLKPRRSVEEFNRFMSSSPCMVQRLKLSFKLEAHSGCVNTLQWNRSGDLLLSGSDDCTLKIWDMNKRELLREVAPGHHSNIFCAHFLPYSDDMQVISCAADGKIIYTDLTDAKETKHTFKCHRNMVYKLALDPLHSRLFFSCGEDGTVRHFDLREGHIHKCGEQDCANIAIDLSNGDQFGFQRKIGINSFSINPFNPNLLVLGGSDPIVRIFDRRKFSEAVRFFRPSYHSEVVNDISRGLHLTSVVYSPNGDEILASYGGDYIYLIDGQLESQPSSVLTCKKYGKHRFFSYEFSDSDDESTDDNEELFEDGENSEDDEEDNVAEQMSEDETTTLTNSKLHTFMVLEGKEEIDDVDTANTKKHKKENNDKEGKEDKEEKEEEEEKKKEEKEEKEEVDNSIYLGFYKKKFSGHLNMRTVKEVNFFGPRGEYVVSGSDDGNVFIWSKRTGKLLQLMEGDRHVVNCLQGHPLGYPTLAVSGIDDDIKIFAPLASSKKTLAGSEKIMEDNEKMLHRKLIPISHLALLQGGDDTCRLS